MKLIRSGFRLLLIAWVSLVGASLFAIELPAIQLQTVFPPGGKAGSDVEVSVTGAEMEETAAMRFSHPGITAKLKAANRFAVTIAPDVPPGIYDARIMGLSGISNPRAFVVGDAPEIVKAKTNNTPDTAFDLPIGAVFSGATTSGANDYFKFTAKKGQRLLVECLGPEIDSRLKPVLAVLDSAMKELEVSRKGGVLDFTAPADGVYFARLSDLSFGGAPDYFYRLSVTAGPHIDFVFPLSGQPGVKSRFTLYGRLLPGGSPADAAGSDGKPLEKLEVEIEPPGSGEYRGDGITALTSADVDGFSYRLKTPQGVSNPVFISLCAALVAFEHKPNDQAAQSQKLTPPCEIDGQYLPAEAAHWFTFDAKKGDIWWVEVLSQRLGARTDPMLLVQTVGADEKEAAGPEVNAIGQRFRTASNDPAYRLEAKADGAYRVAVTDLFASTQADPRKVFRLSIHKESPDFHLAAFVEPPPEKADDRIAVPNAAFVRGSGTTAIRVVAFRRDNFAGDIELNAEGLPAGVTSTPTKILVGKNEGWLLLTASEKPENWAGEIHIVGKAKVGERELTHEARGGAILWPAPDVRVNPAEARLTRDVVLAVAAKEAAPIGLQPAEDKVWEAPAGGKLEIPLKVTRRPEFKEALKLTGLGAPGIETLKPVDIAAGANTGAVTIDLAAVKIPAGEHTIYFQGATKGKFRGRDVTPSIFSAPIRISVKPPAPK